MKGHRAGVKGHIWVCPEPLTSSKGSATLVPCCDIRSDRYGHGYAYLHRLVHGVACGIGYRPAGVVVVAVAGCVHT